MFSGEHLREFKTPVVNFSIPFIGSFAVSITLVVLACLLSTSFRPGSLKPDEYVKLGEEGFLGHCGDCDEKTKYVLICDGTKQMWGWSGYMGSQGMIYYQQSGPVLVPALDLDLWCNVQDLGNIMHDIHAIVWPIVLVLFLLGTAVFYDMRSVKRYMISTPYQLRRVGIATFIHGIAFLIVYLIASAVDESPMNTAAQTVYVFAMMSFALYIPGRLILDQGQRFSDSFNGPAVGLVVALFALPIVYALMLIIAFTLEGRIFHPVPEMWQGAAWCALLMALVVPVNIMVFYLVDDWMGEDAKHKEAFPWPFAAPEAPAGEPEVPGASPYQAQIDELAALPPPEPVRAIEDIEPVVPQVGIDDLGDPEYEEITI